MMITRTTHDIMKKREGGYTGVQTDRALIRILSLQSLLPENPMSFIRLTCGVDYFDVSQRRSHKS